MGGFDSQTESGGGSVSTVPFLPLQTAREIVDHTPGRVGPLGVYMSAYSARPYLVEQGGEVTIIRNPCEDVFIEVSFPEENLYRKMIGKAIWKTGIVARSLGYGLAFCDEYGWLFLPTRKDRLL